MREILRGMSIASDSQDEFITADDYYLQPQQHYDDFNPSSQLYGVSRVDFAYLVF